jgi:hypothetical protein
VLNSATRAECYSCGSNAGSTNSNIHTDCSCNKGYWGAALTTAGTSMECTVMSHAHKQIIVLLLAWCCVTTVSVSCCFDLTYCSWSPHQACDAGKYRGTTGATVAGDCTGCNAGQFAATGSSACTNCDSGKYVAVLNSATRAGCYSCGSNAGSASSTIHTDCSCNKGYWGAALTTAGTSMECTVMSHAPASSCACRRCANGAACLAAAVPMVPVAFHLL